MFPDGGANGFNGLRAVDELDALWFGGGNDAEAVGDALKKFPISFFNAVADEGQC